MSRIQLSKGTTQLCGQYVQDIMAESISVYLHTERSGIYILSERPLVNNHHRDGCRGDTFSSYSTLLTPGICSLFESRSSVSYDLFCTRHYFMRIQLAVGGDDGCCLEVVLFLPSYCTGDTVTCSMSLPMVTCTPVGNTSSESFV